MVRRILLATLLTVFGSTLLALPSLPAGAVGADSWNPGRIIDDAVFQNKSSMSVAQIQQFLDAQQPSCDTHGLQTISYKYDYSTRKVNTRSSLPGTWVTTSRALYTYRAHLYRKFYKQTNDQYDGSPAADPSYYLPPTPYTPTLAAPNPAGVPDAENAWYTNNTWMVCLKDYYQNPSTMASNYGTGVVPAGARSAAQLLYDAAQNQTINPQVFIVMLQKEQSLVGDDWPWPDQYDKATGNNCPDTAPCNPAFAGFWTQVNNAGAQFNYYVTHLDEYNYAPGWNNILYNPNTSCGTQSVYIENRFTAALYIYTPYVPNQAALANMYGTGDGCSAYGNRNFWRMFNDWFGSSLNTVNPLLFARSYSGASGWATPVRDSTIIGTTGQSRALEAISLQGEVEYTAYTDESGWQPIVNRGMVSGSIEMNRPIRAVKIRPIGTLQTRYNIYYRAHISNVGWMDWTSNGLPAGITGSTANKLEAIETWLVPTTTVGPSLGPDSYRNIAIVTPSPELALQASAHVSQYGWQPYVTDTMVAGTMKQKLPIEALKIKLTNATAYSGSIVYSTHLAGLGWQSFVGNDAISGTTGQSRQSEAIRIALTAELGNQYDIYYRTHIQDYGWLGWTKNDRPSGSVGIGKRLEAIEVRLVKKSGGVPPTTSGEEFINPRLRPIPSSFTISYSAYVQDIGWLTPVLQDEMAGTTGQSRRLEALRIDTLASQLGNVALSCTAYVEGDGWQATVQQPAQTCGTTQQSKALQAVKLHLSGDIAQRYRLEYSVHVSHVGWMPWVNDNETAGLPGSEQVEAIKIRLTEL